MTIGQVTILAAGKKPLVMCVIIHFKQRIDYQFKLAILFKVYLMKPADFKIPYKNTVHYCFFSEQPLKPIFKETNLYAWICGNDLRFYQKYKLT